MFMDEDEDVYIDNRSQSGSKTKEEKIAKKNKKNKENIPEEKRNRSKSFFNIKIKRDDKPRSKTVHDCLSLEAERKTVKFADDGLEKGMRLSEQIGQEKAVLSKSETNLVNRSEVKSCLKETAHPKCEESTVTNSTETEVASSPRIEMVSVLTAVMTMHQKLYMYFAFNCLLSSVCGSRFTHILQGYFTGTGAIKWLPQCQWSNPEGYE